MVQHHIVVLPGDGVGAEVMDEALRVLAAVERRLGGGRFALEVIPCGGRYYLEHGRDWPEGSEARCRAADLILLGAVGWPDPNRPGPVTMSDGKMAGHSPVIGNRVNLDLYANVRPVRLYEGVLQRISGVHRPVWSPENVDFLVLRENTEGLYAGSGGILAPGGVSQVATDTRVITRRASERIIRLAFQYAEKRTGAPKDKKRRVTCVVKNNVLYGCKLFAEVFAEIGREFPGVEQELAIVDAMTQWMLTQPEHYDVVVTTNMFGDILTDLAAVLQGGMGMAVGMNLGDRHAMFEPIHGSAPPLAGKRRANPLAMILTLGEALIWLGERKNEPDLRSAGADIERAVQRVLREGRELPEDLVGEGRAVPTDVVTNAVIEALAATAD